MVFIFINVLFIFLLTISIFVLSSRFSHHSIISLLFVYITFSILLLYLNLEIFAIFVILIYAGGVMILFMFFLFISENAIAIVAKTNKKSLSSYPSVLIFAFILSLILFAPLWIVKMQFISTKLLNQFVLLISTNNIHWYLVRWVLFMVVQSNAPAIGFSSSSLLTLGSFMYLAFYLHSLISFSILLSVLLSITTILTDSDIFKYIRSSKSNKNNFFAYTENSLILLVQIAYLFSPFGFISSVFMGFSIFSIFFLILIFLFNSTSSINLLRFLIFMELILLPIIGVFLTSSIFWSNMDGLIMSIFLLSIFASESALGLSILTLQHSSKVFFK